MESAEVKTTAGRKQMNTWGEDIRNAIEYIRYRRLASAARELAGAAHDFICQETGKEYMFFPIRKL